MRASRMLSILTTLQAKGQVTAPELAEACEVSVRTIYRDIDALAARPASLSMPTAVRRAAIACSTVIACG
ncbi:putative DNA-binding transcriptional regulator YafY [Bradyrhizobium sp. F1.13.1]